MSNSKLGGCGGGREGVGVGGGGGGGGGWGANLKNISECLLKTLPSMLSINT